MNGYEYEETCAQVLRNRGFSRVKVTKSSGDQGIDIIAYKNGEKYGIQCKYYSSPVGNKAVQEAYAGSKFYDCTQSAIMTNSTFTKSAKELARKLDVQLWEKTAPDEPRGIFWWIMGFINFIALIMGIISLILAFFVKIPGMEAFNYISSILLIIAGFIGFAGLEGDNFSNKLSGISYFIVITMDVVNSLMKNVFNRKILFFYIIPTIYLLRGYIFSNSKKKVKQEKQFLSDEKISEIPSVSATAESETIISSRSTSDPKRIVYNELTFSDDEYKALNRLKNAQVGKKFTGLLSMQVDYDSFCDYCLEDDLIRLSTPEEDKALIKLEECKDFLREHSLKVSGRKAELIQKIDEYQPSFFGAHHYILTEKALQLLKSHWNAPQHICYTPEHSIETIEEYRLRIVKQIESGKINDAYIEICKHNAAEPVPPGIGIDWARQAKIGLDQTRLSYHEEKLQTSDDKFTTAICIYCALSGENTSDVAKQFAKIIIEEDLTEQKKSILGDQDLLNYKESGIAQYRFLATLDNRTCPQCGKLDGKIFPVKQAKVGVNYPPMHKGCRCTTIACFSEKEFVNTTRIARDPKTGHNYSVPASTTYEEWIKSVSENYDKF